MIILAILLSKFQWPVFLNLFAMVDRISGILFTQ